MEKTTSFIFIKRVAMIFLTVLITSTAWAAVGDFVDGGYCNPSDVGNVTAPRFRLIENGDNAGSMVSGGLTLTISGTGAMRDYESYLESRP